VLEKVKYIIFVSLPNEISLGKPNILFLPYVIFTVASIKYKNVYFRGNLHRISFNNPVNFKVESYT
jgi:hypothetical protein